MKAVKLNEHQQKLRNEIKKELNEIRQDMSEYKLDNITSKIKDLGKKANKLHIELKNTGNEPKHHKYMYENRQVSPDTPEFYEHVHPVEDLLKFIDNPNANDDPIDKTIGEEFEFPVYSRRFGHEDNYKIKRTKDGWEVNYWAIGGNSDKAGYPYLFKNLEQDGIEYPNSLGKKMEWLWEEAKENGLSKDEVQKALAELAEWISEVEKKSPRQGVWQGF